MFIVNCEIYPFDVLVCFGESVNKIAKAGKKFLKKSDIKFLKNKLNTNSNGKYFMFAGGQSLIWLRNNPKTINGLSILQHEIFHCAYAILNKVGIQLDDNSDEVFAYLIEYLTKQIYKEIGITFS